MLKKLDKLVIKAFVGPFIATFFITLMVLIMQFFWLWIDDFVGKGLQTDVILRFIWYQSAALVPLALPLAVLLSSLMTFGNLGESFELVAIKSSGISLLRFMRPLFFVSLAICGIAFLFANFIIPVANLKSRTMLTDIVQAQPAFDLKEGVFYDKLSGFAIKVGKKEANDSVIRDVIVYEQSVLQDNFIIAKSGIMRVSDNKRFLEFILHDGWRYQERGDRYGGQRSEYIRLGFKEYKKKFDLSNLGMMGGWTPDSVNKNNEKMFSMRQLSVAIDSLGREIDTMQARTPKSVYISLPHTRFFDTLGSRKLPTDTSAEVKNAKSFIALVPDSLRQNVQRLALDRLNQLKGGVESAVVNFQAKEKSLRRHKIEWHRKIVLSMACLVLFMIGAPLGSIIRKGGLGTPLIFAIIFFMIFYFSTTTGEKFAKENTMTPFFGMWLATFILTPIGLFLTYKAMRDSQLFNKERYYRLGRTIKGFLSRLKLSKR